MLCVDIIHNVNMLVIDTPIKSLAISRAVFASQSLSVTIGCCMACDMLTLTSIASHASSHMG